MSEESSLMREAEVDVSGPVTVCHTDNRKLELKGN
jgi:hypothetical protein